MKTVTLYTTNYCTYCRQAKIYLQNANIPFKEIDLTENQALREELSNRYNWRTVPMILVEDTFIGGFQDMMALAKTSQLSRLLE